MTTNTPPVNSSSKTAARSLRRAASAAEVLSVYAGILLYIWRWQFTIPWFWIVLLAVIWISHVAHRETLRSLGLTRHELRACAKTTLPLFLLLLISLIVALALRPSLLFAAPYESAFSLGGYTAWCAVQQYLAQSYFHRRLAAVVRSPHLSSLLVGVLFGAAHIPNPVLMIATALGGWIFAEIFARHPNVWPLAITQAVGGILLRGALPPSLIHNMRVGPGYFTYQPQ